MRLDQVVARATGSYSLGSADDHRRVRELADDLVATTTPAELAAINADADRPLDLRIAGKLASSKRAVLGSDWTGPLAVVFAMWGERRRLRPRSEANPTGEDAVHLKLDQLGWLFEGTAVEWLLYPVDDGDPDDSASVAEERVRTHERGHRARVLRLADAIPTETGALARLGHVDDSSKGGAIVHGAEVALDEGAAAVVMTDADISVDLGQLGQLVGPHLAGADVVLGDRKHPEAVLVKAEARWGPGIVVLRHMQRMVGRALFDHGLRDTQAAFKLYSRPALGDILAAPSTFGFAFDSDWLYAAIAGGRSIEAVPFAFIDSFEESASITQGPMTTWESLLRGMVAAARAREVDHDEEMASVVDDHADAEQLAVVVQNVPPELDGVPDARLGDRAVMSPSQLRTWLEALGQD